MGHCIKQLAAELWRGFSATRSVLTAHGITERAPTSRRLYFNMVYFGEGRTLIRKELSRQIFEPHHVGG